MLRSLLFAALALTSTLAAPAQPAAAKKVLFFTKSSGFEHSVITRRGQPSLAEQRLTDLAPKHGIAFTFSKDGSLFTPEYLAQFDAYLFFTSGDLLAAGKDGNPPMTPAGKAALLDAIAGGKGFVGLHSASDTFHTGETVDTDTRNRAERYQNHGDKADPYIRMIGGEFILHGAQQVAKLLLADPKFPGLAGKAESVEFKEEWYSFSTFAPDLHVILVQETAGMTGAPYKRPPFPSTWARMHGKGRVFYSALGHRDDIWINPFFEDVLFGGIAWAVRNVDADVTPNIATVTPGHTQLPPQSSPPQPVTPSLEPPAAPR